MYIFYGLTQRLWRQIILRLVNVLSLMNWVGSSLLSITLCTQYLHIFSIIQLNTHRIDYESSGYCHVVIVCVIIAAASIVVGCEVLKLIIDVFMFGLCIVYGFRIFPLAFNSNGIHGIIVNIPTSAWRLVFKSNKNRCLI